MSIELSKEKILEELMKWSGQTVFAKLPDNLPCGVKMETCGTLSYQGNSVWRVGKNCLFPFKQVCQTSAGDGYLTIILDV